MNNRDLIKKAIKKLVLQEIANNQFGTPIQYDKKDTVGIDALNKSLGKGSTVMQIRGTGKTMGATKNQEVQLNKNCDACYDVVSVTNESERKIARGVSLEAAMELVKKHAGDSEKTYVQKAYDKSLKGFGLKTAERDADMKLEDTMDDADEELQIDIADDNTEKADVKADKENGPINKDVSASMGGEMVDKIEKIIDRVLKLKAKADATTAHLKTDKDMESSDKLTTKLKDTPALKEKK
jgi:hypothetical protein